MKTVKKGRPAKKQKAGPAYLLLRGLGRESKHWGSFYDIMKKQYNALTLDLPGVGSERQRPCPASIAEIVDDIRNRWLQRKAEENISDKVGLLAISLGGMIALDWVFRYPKDFNRLVLINSSSRLSPFYRRLRPASYPDFLYSMFTRSKTRRENRMFSRTCNSDADRPDKVGLWIRLAEERPLRRLTFFRQLYAASRFVLPEALNIPTLMLGSSRDRLVHIQCSRDLSAYYRLPLIEHPWAGHDLTTDDGAWVVDQVRRFEKQHHIK